MSRFLALVLRHRAYQFDLEVDDEGFISLDDLMGLLSQQNSLAETTEEEVRAVADAPGRRRFEIRDRKIRATYGHSFRRLVSYPAVEPPEFLYIGVPRGQMAEVRTGGVKPSGRQYIHLSEDREEALEIAKGQDAEPMVITVLARKAAERGLPFHHPAEGLYLSPPLAVEYLDIEVRYGRSDRRGRRRP